MFYIDFMPKQTKEVFDTLARYKFINEFTLVGGTALSIQIKHRQSEDLDFIFDGEYINKTKIKRNINSIFQNFKIIKEDENFQIDFLINDVKVTFFSTGAIIITFNVGGFSNEYQNINVASPNIIGVLKLSAITQRNTIRDYYDLYFLTKYVLNIKDLFKMTKKLVPNLSPITYSETLAYTEDIAEDSIVEHLNPKEIITKEEISNYFISELRKVKESI